MPVASVGGAGAAVSLLLAVGSATRSGFGSRPGSSGNAARGTRIGRLPVDSTPAGNMSRLVVSSMMASWLAGADDSDDFLALLPYAQLGRLEEPVDDVRVGLHPVVDELGVSSRRQDEERRCLAIDQRFGKPDVRLVPVVEDLSGDPLGAAAHDLHAVTEV